MKIILNIIIVVLVIILGLVLGMPLYRISQPSQIKIVCEPTVSSLPLFVAEKYGVFKERKVAPEITLEESPEKMLEMLKKGEADVIVVPWIDAIKWMADNKDTLRCFFSVEFKPSAPCDGIITRKKFRLFRDLNKRKIATSPLYMLTLKTMTLSGGIEVQFVPVPFKDAEKALKENDAVLLVDPYFSYLRPKANIFESPAMAKWITAPFPGSGYFVKQEYFEKNKLALIRLKEALDIAFIYMQRDKDTARVIVTQKLGVPNEVADSIRLPNYMRVHEIEKMSIQILADRLYGYGVVKEKVDMGPVIIPVAELRR